MTLLDLKTHQFWNTPLIPIGFIVTILHVTWFVPKTDFFQTINFKLKCVQTQFKKKTLFVLTTRQTRVRSCMELGVYDSVGRHR